MGRMGPHGDKPTGPLRERQRRPAASSGERRAESGGRREQGTGPTAANRGHGN
jgi:hypothetical protein